MALRITLCAGLVAAAALLLQCQAQSTRTSVSRGAATNVAVLEKVVVLSRHGVRSPLLTREKLAMYSTGTWPDWDAPPGNLTVHGAKLMTALGSFYAEYYGAKGLFQGHGCQRMQNVYVWSDVDERDVATAKTFMDGLFPGCTITINKVPDGQIDPVIHPLAAHLGHADKQMAVAEVLGRIGGNAEYVKQAYMPAFLTLDKVLGGCGQLTCPGESSDRQVLFGLKADIEPAEDSDHLIRESTGPLGVASTLVETILLEYADGKPMSEVGFGRLSRSNLTQILSLHSLYFDLSQETSYPARSQGSNIMGHILATLSHTGPGDGLIRGGFGEHSSRLVFIAAHDTTIANVAGILHAHWYVPGDQEDPSLPGGGLVFELWRHPADNTQWVRVRYISETLDQMHTNESLTPANPPAIVPIILSDCIGSGGSFECRLPAFRKMVTSELMPSFMTQ